jgi:hypothetical protein
MRIGDYHWLMSVTACLSHVCVCVHACACMYVCVCHQAKAEARKGLPAPTAQEPFEPLDLVKHDLTEVCACASLCVRVCVCVCVLTCVHYGRPKSRGAVLHQCYACTYAGRMHDCLLVG